MTFQGDLHGINLADVFQNIAANRTTGTLQVQLRKGERYVRFVHGKVVGFSIGIGKGMPLLNHLRERGYVDEKQIDRLLNKNRRSRKSPCRLILEARLLSEDEMSAVLAEVVGEHIYELMVVREARFSFREGDPPSRVFDADQKNLGLSLEIGPLLMESARRKDEMERIQRVVSSEHDLFLLLEGWEDLELDETVYEVTPLLDGRTDVRTIQRQLSTSRFFVMKAIADLVYQGAARPCTADEIQSLVDEAVQSGDQEEALRLLGCALNLERSNQDLRQHKADLLTQMGRQKDAAAEYAQMGHKAAQDSEIDLAVELYGQAVELSPSDLPMRVKQLELLQKKGDRHGRVTKLIELVDLYVEMGLADRARILLEETVEEKGFEKDTPLLEKLAEVEASLGHWEPAAKVFLRLADGILSKDEAAGIAYLKSALEQRPEDQALAARIEDIESGRQKRRRSRRRRLTAAVVAVCVMVALGFAGVAEIIASHGVLRALDQGLGPMRHGEGVEALTELHEVRQSYGWTLSGQRVDRLIERVVNLQLAAVEELLARSEYDRAAQVVERVAAELHRPDLQSTCETLRERVQTERKAFGILRRADLEGLDPRPGDLAMVKGLTDGRYLDFHLVHLPTVKNEKTRSAMLVALSKMDNPRIFPVVARLSLKVDGPGSLSLIKTILERAAVHRAAGREAEWAEVYPDLEEALLHPATRGQAQFVLSMLRGNG